MAIRNTFAAKMPNLNKTERLLAERDRLIARNKINPQKRNETRIWNINLELAVKHGTSS